MDFNIREVYTSIKRIDEDKGVKKSQYLVNVMDHKGHYCRVFLLYQATATLDV